MGSATLPWKSSIESLEEYYDLVGGAVEKIRKSGGRIIVLSCLPEQVADYFRVALEKGMVGEPYIYLVLGAASPAVVSVYFEDDLELLDKFRKNIRGMIGLSILEPEPGELSDEWVEAWNSGDSDLFGVGRTDLALLPSTAYFRDAVYTLAMALDKMIRRGEDVYDGKRLLETIQKETDFIGLTGHVALKENGDRFPMYDIRNAQDFELGFQKIGRAEEGGLFFKEEAIFADGTTEIPDAAEQVYVDWGDVEAIVMLVLCGVGLLVALVCLVVMMSNRETPIMNYASPRFVCGMGVGVIAGFVYIVVWTGVPTSGKCQARPWVLVLNFVLIFGHLYAKAMRFLLIMKRRKTLLFRPIPDIQLFLYVFCYLLVFSIPCIVWTAAFPLDVTRSDNNPDNDKVNLICDGEHANVFFGILLALGGLSLLVGVVVAFLNREYHDFFSEATYIGYTLFTVCITCCVVLPMLFILNDTPHAFYVVLMLGVFLCNVAVVVFMFFPKVYVIFHPKMNVVPLDGCGSLKTKKNSGTTPTP